MKIPPLIFAANRLLSEKVSAASKIEF